MVKCTIDWEKMYKVCLKESERMEKELATLKASLPKIKADAVLDYEESLSSFHWTADEYIKNKLEAGE